MRQNSKIKFISIILLGIIAGGGILLSNASKSEINQNQIITGIVKEQKQSPFAFNNNPEIKEKNRLDKQAINILLVGTDTSIGRRARGQLGFNTDSIIMVSINRETKKVLLTSVPRDLWVGNNKINALYIVSGEQALMDAFKEITGLEVDGVIRADFDGFKWVVDAFGGIPVNVERSFTDSNFPNNTDSGPITVTFTEGSETMDSDRALIYARSRKGTNGEGSDLMRAKRQHILLKGIVEAVKQPTSKFWPMDIKSFYEAAQSIGNIYTNLSLDDAYFLWNFYSKANEYSVESFVVDSDYLYHPGMYPESIYRAWVFIPKNNSFEQLQRDIKAKLDGTFIAKDATQQPENAANL